MAQWSPDTLTGFSADTKIQINNSLFTCAVTILSPLVALARSKEGWESLVMHSAPVLGANRPPVVKFSLETAKRLLVKK